MDGSDTAMLEQDPSPNLATETKYSLVKNQIVRAEKPAEEEVTAAEAVIEAEVHSKESEAESDEEEDASSKSVRFHEESKVVPDVGDAEQEEETQHQDPLELEEVANLASARAVSTPASESSPRPSAAEENPPAPVEADRPASAKSQASEVDGGDNNKLGRS